MRAIVWDGKQASVESGIEARDLRAGEVRVRIEAAGLCHSDVSVLNGTIMFPPPVVLGHEGAGEVIQIAPDVTNVAVGDHVVLSTLGNCGQCAQCDRGKPTFCRQSLGKLSRPFTSGEGEEQKKLFQFANLGVFAEETVVKATQAVRIPKEVPLTSASLIGCGVLTGVGAVFNRAKVQQGESVVVIGVGGIGLNAIQGAALSGGLPVIAVDTNPGKEAFARQFGATHFICPDGPDFDLVAAVKEICPNGVDYVFECVGSTALIKTSTDLLDWGGTLVMLGVPKMGSEASFVVNTMYNDKTIMGCRYGSARPQYDIPLMVRLYQAGRLKLDELVTRRYSLDDINQGYQDMRDGRNIRGIIEL